MAGCGKGRHYVCQFLRIEVFNRVFASYASASKSTDDAWPAAAKAENAYANFENQSSFSEPSLLRVHQRVLMTHGQLRQADT
eukprot:12407040-Karenia_brevis.AAC.1